MITSGPTTLLNVQMPPSHQFLGQGGQPQPHSLHLQNHFGSPQQHPHLHYHPRMRGVNPADPSLDEDPSSSHNDDDDFGKDAKVVLVPGPHDVLLGRGGGTNNHSGNVKFRQLVGEHKVQYFSSSKVEKPQVARLVVNVWRKLDPPGRFLMRKEEPKKGSANSKSSDGFWYEVGDKKAREKASQCLRERTAEVMPYIRQIREEQDALTEQGVITFQESVMRHKQEEAQRLAAKASQPPTEVIPVTPSSSTGTDVEIRKGDVGPARGSVRAGPRSRYPPAPTASFSRRTSCPTMAGPPPPLPAHAAMSRRSSLPIAQGAHPMYPTSADGGAPYEYPYGSDPDYYYSESNIDYAYQSSMLEMQRQMEVQEMQMQEMQERMRMQHQHMRQQQMMHRQGQMMPLPPPPPPPPVGPVATMTVTYPPVATVSPNATLPDDDDEEEFDPLPIDDADDALLIDIPINTSGPEATSVTLARSDSKSSKSKRTRDDSLNKENSEHSSKSKSSAAAPAAAAPDGACDARPDVPKSSSLVSHGTGKAAQDVVTSLTHALQADGEVTIEEYRRQLQAYMFNNHLGEPGSSAHDAYHQHGDDDDHPSDLDDDDEDEPKHHHPRRQGAPRRRRSSRGVDRNVSGCSFMSTDTHLSTNLSVFSNMSMLSENLSASSCGARERKMNAARSLSSNLSLMSDVTDISHALDDLRMS